MTRLKIISTVGESGFRNGPDKSMQTGWGERRNSPQNSASRFPKIGWLNSTDTLPPLPASTTPTARDSAAYILPSALAAIEEPMHTPEATTLKSSHDTCDSIADLATFLQLQKDTPRPSTSPGRHRLAVSSPLTAFKHISPPEDAAAVPVGGSRATSEVMRPKSERA